MKKVILILMVLIFQLSFSQITKVQGVGYKPITTVQRDALVIPAGERWKIFNSDTGVFEYWDGSAWSIFSGSGGVTDHLLLTNIGTNSHAIIDTHLANGNVHFLQSAISITESQISDLNHTVDTNTQLSDGDVGAFGYIKTYTEVDPIFLVWDKSTGISITESQISDLTHTPNQTLSIISDQLTISNGNTVTLPSVGGSALTFSLPLSETGDVVSMTQAGLAQNGWLSSVDFNTFNNKVSFPGFTNLLTDYSFTDNSTNWNLAFGWGDHSIQNYSIGAHTVDTNTQLSQAEVGAFAIAEGFVDDLNNQIIITANYTTALNHKDAKIILEAPVTSVILDDTGLPIGWQLSLVNNAGGYVTFSLASGDGILTGQTLNDLPQGKYAYVEVKDTNTWSVIITDVASGGGDTLPIDDATAVVKGSVDATKTVGIEADGVATGTRRNIIMPDSDVDLGDVALKSEYNVFSAGALFQTIPVSFSSSITVPTPTSSGHATTKSYVDSFLTQPNSWSGTNTWINNALFTSDFKIGDGTAISAFVELDDQFQTGVTGFGIGSGNGFLIQTNGFTEFRITQSVIRFPLYTDLEIDAANDDSAVTKGYVKNNYVSSDLTALTGVDLVLDCQIGKYYNMASANSGTTYSFGGGVIGGFAKSLINTTSEPTVTGATKIAGATWVTGTNMYLVVSFNGTATQYFFLEI